jgi:hypothetical protein
LDGALLDRAPVVEIGRLLGELGPGGRSVSKEDGKVGKEEQGKSPFPLGAAQVLRGGVVEAFGRSLGFIIIMTALILGLAVGIGTVVTMAKALGRFL